MKILIIGIFSVITINTFGCSCAGLVGIDVVEQMFIGKVKKIEVIEGKKHVTLKVKKVYKGTFVRKEFVTVITGKHSASCGIPFIKSMNFAVYGNGDTKEIHASRCSKTTILLPFQRFIYKPKKSSGWF